MSCCSTMCCSSICNRVVNFFKGITVEPLFFLFAFGHGLNYLIVQSLYIEKVCFLQIGFLLLLVSV